MVRKRNALLSDDFFILAFYVGNWAIRIPDIKTQVNTSYTGMGFAGMAFAAGSVMMMVFSSRIIRILSSRRAILYSSCFIAAGFAAIPFAENLPVLLAISFGTGVAIGLTEVAMNVQASHLETTLGKPMMSGFHAFFSLGLLAGSLCASSFVELNISLTANFVVIAVVLFALTVSFSTHLIEDLEKESHSAKRSIFFRWPNLILLLIVISIACSVIEATVDS